jgi:CBS domain-containing protein
MLTGYKAGDAMTKVPIQVSSSTTLEDCCTLMNKKQVGSLLVNDAGIFKGIITNDLIIRAIANKYNVRVTKCHEIMNTNIDFISPSMDIYDALIKMSELDVRQLPVKNDDGKFVGLLTQKDILKIEPTLFEIIAGRLDVREEDAKPIFQKGSCDLCGKKSDNLMKIQGELVCEDCRIF